MKPIKLGNGKALQITETQTIREIGALLKKYGRGLKSGLHGLWLSPELSKNGLKILLYI